MEKIVDTVVWKWTATAGNVGGVNENSAKSIADGESEQKRGNTVCSHKRTSSP